MHLSASLGLLGFIIGIAIVLLIAAIVVAFIAGYGNCEEGDDCDKDGEKTPLSKCRKYARWAAWLLVAFLVLKMVVWWLMMISVGKAIDNTASRVNDLGDRLRDYAGNAKEWWASRGSDSLATMAQNPIAELRAALA